MTNGRHAFSSSKFQVASSKLRASASDFELGTWNLELISLMSEATPKLNALVTGASGGIGLELARLFAADGHDLVLVARSKDKLSALADELTSKHNVRARALPADLARREAPRETFDELQAAGISVDALVNNAAIG